MITNTPKSLGYRMPAEWEKQEAIWLAWPHNEETWHDGIIKEVDNSYIEFVKALHTGQKVKILVNDEDFENNIKNKLKNKNINLNQIIFYQIKTIDAWIRDYGPTFLINQKNKQKAIVKWNFTAWGNKYDDLKEDNEVSYKLNKILNLPLFEPKIVLEGGSIEVNGSGALLTTEQCLLNKNRNPQLNKQQIEQYLKNYFNVSNILWLKEGIAGDDTDGHIDDIARFVSQNTLVCAFEENKSDENYDVLKENYELLVKMKDEKGERLNVVKLPMPGFVGDEEMSEIVKNKSKLVAVSEHAQKPKVFDRRYPASYANFYIGNETVCVPTFNDSNDEKALKIIQNLFPARKTVGINCRAMVYGFGSLHCVSLQEPKI